MGGKTTDCSLIKSTAPYSFQIANPATQTYSTTAPNGLPVTFTLTVASDKKSFGFTSTGAAVYDISVAPTSIDEKDDDDPTGTAWYQYSKAAIGPVTNDTALHTTKSKKGVFHAVSRVTFCYASAASISGTVVNDANNNGAKNSGETGQAGWTVNLEKTGGAQPFATTQTGSGGAYTFASVPVGSAYSVCIVPPSGWKQTFPTGATSGCAAAGAPAGESNAGFALPTLVKNQSGLDFGLVQLGSISGTAFVDANSNGQNDSGDSPQGGVTVSLYQTGGSSPLSTTTTAGDGTYSFANVPVVQQGYTVCETSGPTSAQTLPTATTPGHVACHGGEFPLGYGITLTPSGVTGLDFGSIPLASISGTAFLDTNNNGQNDSGDSPQQNLTVNLYQTGGSVALATTLTDTNGAYTFPSVPVVPQGYTVCETPPGSNWAQTLPTSTTSGEVACHTGEFPLGYGIVLTSAGATGLDFGSVQTVAASCTSPFGTNLNYQAQLAPDACATSKSLVYGYDDADAHKFAALQQPFGSTTAPVPIVEEITWTLPTDHHQIVVLYNDSPTGNATVDRNAALTMKYCNFDPRSPQGSGLTLTTGLDPSTVLPSGEASCIVAQTTSLVDNTFRVVVFSSIDGLRFGGP